jgi:hypothetical protein
MSKTDGKTRITLVTSAISFEEQSVTPPGINGGDGIDNTHHGLSIRRKSPRSTKEVTPSSATVLYNPSQRSVINAAINLLQPISIDYQDGDQDTFYGWLKEFSPGANTEGEQPTAEIVIEAAGTNAAGAEEGVTYATATTS